MLAWRRIVSTADQFRSVHSARSELCTLCFRHPEGTAEDPTDLEDQGWHRWGESAYRPQLFIRDPVLISRRQQFVVPAITYQRRIVQSRRGTNTLAVSRLHDCVIGVAGVPVRSRSRHLFIPTQEVAVRTLPQDTVDPGLRVQANYAVRPDPLVRNDLVRTTRPRHTF